MIKQNSNDLSELPLKCISEHLTSFLLTKGKKPGWAKKTIKGMLSFDLESQNGQQHFISADPQHWCSTGLRPQTTPLLPVHTWLCSHTQLQHHRQIRWRHNGDRLITDNDETAYRAEVSTLTKWCQENHLSLNIDKTKELVVDFRRQSREHTPIIIDKTPVERVNSFKFLGVHITEDFTWSAHTDAVLKKSHQRLFFLRRLRKFGMSPSILRSFYTCTVESILTGCITAWFGNSTAGNRKALQRVVRTARHIVGGELPSLQDIYTRRCIRKARGIINDSSHPSHRLFSLLPSGRRLRSIRSLTSRLRDSFFPQAIRLMNSQN